MNDKLPAVDNDNFVGSVLISRDVMVIQHTEYNIYKLTQPTQGGATHAAINAFGDPVLLLSKDKEGMWAVELQMTNGIIEKYTKPAGLPAKETKQ